MLTESLEDIYVNSELLCSYYKFTFINCMEWSSVNSFISSFTQKGSTELLVCPGL